MMKEFKGTKGPWKLISWQVIQGEGYVVISEAKDSATIVAACIDEPEDASLIAAAPDLLEALQEVLYELSTAREAHDGTIRQADAAIAKALGETK